MNIFRRSAPSAGAKSYAFLALIASAISISSFLYFFRTGQILLYGDAVAHINIARRVFDSRTPGWQQLGTVWLPLPHILTMPFIVADRAWQSGWGGSVVSMVSFVFGSLGIARLFWSGALGSEMKIAGWVGALFFAANPNLIYLQSTAMTEPLSLALYIWVLVFFAEFTLHRRQSMASATLSWQREAQARCAAHSLEKCALVLAAGMLTRYDHWVLAFVIALSSALLLRLHNEADKEVIASLRRGFLRFAILIVLVPLLWLGYNFGTYGNALEFATGPYSARAIAQRSSSMPTYPGEHELHVAALYYFKSAKLNVAESFWIWPILFAAAAGTLVLLSRKRISLLVALWLPLGFYTFAVAHLSVPIFMPVWWPFSYYNVRYGIELLPAFAVFVGITFSLSLRLPKKWARASAFILILLFAGAYFSVWQTVPICLREARVNSVTRLAFESALASELGGLPRDASILMYTGNHVGAIESADIHLARTINENNYRLWPAALAEPARSADYVVAMQGDPVAGAVREHPQDLVPMATIEVPGQPPAVLYRSTGKP